MNIIETEESKDIQAYLSFKLSDELFALGVGKVIEILEVTKITKIPRAPSYMKGVINLRGNVLPLIDTRIKFGLPPIEFTVNTCIVVMDIEVEGESIQIGALVDAVLEVLDIDEKNIQSSPSIDAEYKMEFIKGMVHIGDDFIMLLNIDEVFSLEDIELLKVSKDSKEAKGSKNTSNGKDSKSKPEVAETKGTSKKSPKAKKDQPTGPKSEKPKTTKKKVKV